VQMRTAAARAPQKKLKIRQAVITTDKITADAALALARRCDQKRIGTKSFARQECQNDRP